MSSTYQSIGIRKDLNKSKDKLKTYNIKYSLIQYIHHDIEAESEKDALNKFYDFINGMSFDDYDDFCREPDRSYDYAEVVNNESTLED